MFDTETTPRCLILEQNQTATVKSIDKITNVCYNERVRSGIVEILQFLTIGTFT